MDDVALRRMLTSGILEPYIRHIRFPQYKNLQEFLRLDFTFPITALVGENGTNKSSILRALYGAPGQNNVGNHWFSTATDPIVDGNSFPNCFIYGYRNSHTNQTVEVLKTRISKEGDPDYWEPSRRIRRYGMDELPEFDENDPNRLKTRWQNITKDATLVDFRHSLSAFDKYFYFGDVQTPQRLAEKKALIRRRSPHLASAIDSGSRSHYWYIERIVNGVNSALSARETQEIGRILGRTYEEIHLIFHNFFDSDGYTARLTHRNHRYTEAFAGSGEFAVIMLVVEIMRAPPRSLILLDEPEVSLHPGAQKKLLDFIFQQVRERHHQVIFTTHSPALIRGLPEDAIKVLSIDPAEGSVILTSQTSLPEEAFIKIGEPSPGIKQILVEDRLAAEMLRAALRVNHPQLLNLIEIRFYPGGAPALFQHYIRAYSAESREDVLCFLDGDARGALPWPTAREINRAANEDLKQLVLGCCGSDIAFPLDSATPEQREIALGSARRSFLKWCGENVRYLPRSCPEEFILIVAGIDPEGDPKNTFVGLSRERLGLVNDEQPTSDDIFGVQKACLAPNAGGNADLLQVAEDVYEFFRRD